MAPTTQIPPVVVRARNHLRNVDRAALGAGNDEAVVRVEAKITAPGTRSINVDNPPPFLLSSAGCDVILYAVFFWTWCTITNQDGESVAFLYRFVRFNLSTSFDGSHVGTTNTLCQFFFSVMVECQYH